MMSPVIPMESRGTLRYVTISSIVPTYGIQKQELSKSLWLDVRQLSFLIEPILMISDRWSPLYDDVMHTGIAV